MGKKKLKKLGRPPKPREEKLSQRVTVWLTIEERQLIEQEARQTGRTLSEMIMSRWREEK